jgi:hypothetical protein
LGWATIVHPFHPLRGQRFFVLKIRRISGVDSLSLRRSSDGSFAVPREWTDLAEPAPYTSLKVDPLTVDFECLVALAELVEEIRRGLYK